MNALENVKTKLKPGQVYRRSDLEKWSRSVDRDVAGLVNEGALVKVGSGLYQCPQRSRFGVLPASTDKLLTSFLKDDEYLVTSPNDYNALGLGTTQLYNYQVVYNHKRHGRFELGGQLFEFHRKPRFPKKATAEFLLVDLVNNLDQLAEDRDAVLARVRAKVPEMDARRLRAAVKSFAKVATRKLLEEALGERCLSQNQPPSIPPYQGGGHGLSPSLDKGMAGEGFAFDSAYLPYNKNFTTLARENRNNPTAAENRIWQKVLRMRQFADYKFLRQKPVGDYIVDFYCAGLQLVIEIDGDSHAETAEYDAERTRFLGSLGLRVIRFSNDDVLRNIEGVYEELSKTIAEINCV